MPWSPGSFEATTIADLQWLIHVIGLAMLPLPKKLTFPTGEFPCHTKMMCNELPFEMFIQGDGVI